jgi:hypothetical protein
VIPYRILILAVALALLAGGKAVAIEEPEYAVVKTYPDFELRRYAAHLVAETAVTGDFDEVGSKAFRVLADYIFGNNLAKEKMEMTAPVSQRAASGVGESLEMTAPVTQRPIGGAGSGNFILSFVMPSRYTLETLPDPLSSEVRLREEPARLMAVRGYTGRWTESSYRENESRLLRAVKEAGLTPASAPVYARYNSPFSLPFLRRNEVMIEVVGFE